MKLILALSLLLAVASAAPKRLVVPVKDARVDKSRIIAGSPAAPGQFPFQVLDFTETSTGTSYCGAALISSRWVLTAAHCAVGTSSHTLHLGTTSSNGHDPDSIVVYTTSYIVHENYDSYYLLNDVTLVDLINNVQFTERIYPIRLGSRVVQPDAPVLASGWGNTGDRTVSSTWISPFLNFVHLITVSNEECAVIHGAWVVDSTLCAKGNPVHSTCYGDSGGPLFEYDSAKEPHHIGVVSFVSGAGCISGHPSAFARTSSFIPWIESHTGPL
ncbi:hypothetical protein FQA39_LY02951 [Lamprigera yunnana]|nr:hypothetical protein FQA39_LY02951 [Lamprigera yunnana]